MILIVVNGSWIILALVEINRGITMVKTGVYWIRLRDPTFNDQFYLHTK